MYCRYRNTACNFSVEFTPPSRAVSRHDILCPSECAVECLESTKETNAVSATRISTILRGRYWSLTDKIMHNDTTIMTSYTEWKLASREESGWYFQKVKMIEVPRVSLIYLCMVVFLKETECGLSGKVSDLSACEVKKHCPI